MSVLAGSTIMPAVDVMEYSQAFDGCDSVTTTVPESLAVTEAIGASWDLIVAEVLFIIRWMPATTEGASTAEPEANLAPC